MYSAVLIIPAALRDAADAAGAAMGWGPVSYSVPLAGADAVEGEATHWGCRADVGEQFVGWVLGLDPLPDPAIQPVLDALIADFSPDPTAPDETGARLWGRAHFDAVLEARGLHRVRG